MRYLRKYNESLSDKYNDIIDDNLAYFCDDYHLNMVLDDGYLVNNGFVDDKMMPDLIEMAKKHKTDIYPKRCIRVELIPKDNEFSSNWGLSVIKLNSSTNDEYKNASLE